MPNQTGTLGANQGPFLFSWDAPMPKMKTHKASRKRFRVSATGKMKRTQAGKKHLLSNKTGKRKRHLREKIVDKGKLSRKYMLIMGEKV